MNRNAALRKASDALKKKVPEGTKIEIVWKKTGSKDREVEVAGTPAFRQTIDDQVGTFLSSYADLQV